MSPRTYNTQQAADAVGIARVTLQAWIASRKFKAPSVQVRKGRAVRIWTQSDVNRLQAVKAEIYQEKRPKK